MAVYEASLVVPHYDAEIVGSGHGVVRIVVRPDDALEVNGLAGAVDGTVGVEIAHQFWRYELEVDVGLEVPGRNAVVPACACQGGPAEGLKPDIIPRVHVDVGRHIGAGDAVAARGHRAD